MQAKIKLDQRILNSRRNQEVIGGGGEKFFARNLFILLTFVHAVF